MSNKSYSQVLGTWLSLAVVIAACAGDGVDPNLAESESTGASSITADSVESMEDDGNSSIAEESGSNDSSAESGSETESSTDSDASPSGEEATNTSNDSDGSSGDDADESDGSSGDDGDDDEDDSDASSDDEDDSDASSDDSDGSSGEESTEDPDQTLARGIELTMVEANQAVQVALATDGEIVKPEDREVELIEGRRTYIRAHWDVPNNWKAREIEAVLVLGFPDGSETKLKQTKEISKKSNPDKLDGSFTWMLEPDNVVPDLDYSVTFYEVDDSQDAEPDPMTPPRFPREGVASVGVVEGEMELKVVFIIADTESGPPEATDEQKKKVEDEVFENYPIQKLIAEWRTEKHENFKGSRDGFRFLQRLREEDDADPNAYYHLFVSNKDHRFGWSGVANMASATKQSASRRVAMTVSRRSVDRGRSTVVHEIGHNHGRRHSPCGGAGGADEDFPHPEARLGVPGLRILAKEVITMEKYRDYMSYCRPRWPSDYYYQLNLKRIRTLTSWDYRGIDSEPNDERSLVGTIDSDGNMHWKLIRGRIGVSQATRNSNNMARIWSEGIVTDELPIWRTQIEDAGLQQVVIAVGTHFHADFVDVVIDGNKYQAPIGAIEFIAPPVRE